MNETDQDIQASADDVSPDARPPLPSPGQILQKCREDLGLSHARVADALHMTVHYVKALESDQYEKLPGKTFVKGYFRSYAKYVGANVDEILDLYQRYVDAMEASEVTEANVIRARKAYDQNIRWLICAAVIIVAVVGISWWLSGREETAARVANTRTPAVATNSQARVEPIAPVAPAGNTAENLISNASPVTADVVMDAGKEDGQELAGTVPPADENNNGGAPGETVPVQVPAAIAAEEANPDPVAEAVRTEIAELASAAEVQAEVQDTEVITPSDMPEYTITRIDDHRRVELASDGEDILDVHFSGASWIEIDNADNDRLYHDMLRTGDELSVRGKAPFNILIGDANMVDIRFNSRPVQISRIRDDNSVRIILEPETR